MNKFLIRSYSNGIVFIYDEIRFIFLEKTDNEYIGRIPRKLVKIDNVDDIYDN